MRKGNREKSLTCKKKYFGNIPYNFNVKNSSSVS